MDTIEYATLATIRLKWWKTAFTVTVPIKDTEISE